MAALLQNKYFSLEQDNELALIWLDQENSPLNTISTDQIQSFVKLMEIIEKDGSIRAVVFLSRKKDFIAGADLEGFLRMKPGDAARMGENGHGLLNRIQYSNKPFVAAINGNCVGAGLEMVLACKGRIASNHRSTVLALPEVKLGLLPGGGGTQRLPRLVGLPVALDMILTGKNVFAARALQTGLVDRLTSPENLPEAAKAYARELLKGKKPRRRKPTILHQLLGRFSLTRTIVLRKARELVIQETKGNYPAPLLAIDCIETGLNHGTAAGSKQEITLFDQLVQSPQSRQLIRMFFAITDMKKNPQADEVREISKIGVLGAGLMGKGIAEVSILNGYQVKQSDAIPEALTASQAKLESIWAKKLKQGALLAEEVAQQRANFQTVEDGSHFNDVQLVIEAVSEDLTLKQEMLKSLEKVMASNTIFATNTSALQIADIASVSQRPGQVIGMHYFSPVPKMPLLEIVVTPQTESWVTASAIEVGIKQGKTCIVVKDGPGFYTTRILAAMLNEALLLIEEGADPLKLDKSMKLFGFPVGPITLIDEVGIDIGAHVTAGSMQEMFVSRGGKASDLLQKMLAAGYKGRKNLKGFYRYDIATGKRIRDEIDNNIFHVIGKKPHASFSSTTIRHRLSMMMVSEAVWCLHEGVIGSPRDGDIGAVLGLGFPPFLGGPFRYLDSLGERNVKDMLQELEQNNGPRFKPCPLLNEYAQAGILFYPQ